MYFSLSYSQTKIWKFNQEKHDNIPAESERQIDGSQLACLSSTYTSCNSLDSEYYFNISWSSVHGCHSNLFLIRLKALVLGNDPWNVTIDEVVAPLSIFLKSVTFQRLLCMQRMHSRGAWNVSPCVLARTWAAKTGAWDKGTGYVTGHWANIQCFSENYSWSIAAIDTILLKGPGTRLRILHIPHKYSKALQREKREISQLPPTQYSQYLKAVNVIQK